MTREEQIIEAIESGMTFPARIVTALNFKYGRTAASYSETIQKMVDDGTLKYVDRGQLAMVEPEEQDTMVSHEPSAEERAQASTQSESDEDFDWSDVEAFEEDEDYASDSDRTSDG